MRIGARDPARVDAYEYLLLVYVAHHEFTSGTPPDAMERAADKLRATAPQHSLVRLLDAKVAVPKLIRQLSEAPGRNEP